MKIKQEETTIVKVITTITLQNREEIRHLKDSLNYFINHHHHLDVCVKRSPKHPTFKFVKEILGDLDRLDYL